MFVVMIVNFQVWDKFYHHNPTVTLTMILILYKPFVMETFCRVSHFSPVESLNVLILRVYKFMYSEIDV